MRKSSMAVGRPRNECWATPWAVSHSAETRKPRQAAPERNLRLQRRGQTTRVTEVVDRTCTAVFITTLLPWPCPSTRADPAPLAPMTNRAGAQERPPEGRPTGGARWAREHAVPCRARNGYKRRAEGEGGGGGAGGLWKRPPVAQRWRGIARCSLRPHPGISLRQRVDGNGIVGCCVILVKYLTPS